MMNTMLARKKHERGDTIVEVMIAILIIATILIGAFTVTTRSSQNIRDSEEHAQALQLLQGQIEQLRADATDPAKVGSIPNDFCYDSSGARTSIAAGTFGCQAFSGPNGGVPYQFSISKQAATDPTIDTATFTAKVQWDSVTGATASERLIYKIKA